MKYQDYANRKYAELEPYFNKDGTLGKSAVLKLLLDEEYGHLNNVRYSTDFEVVDEKPFGRGNIIKTAVNLLVNFDDETIKIPFSTFVPDTKDKCPAFLHIGFFNDYPNAHLPVEEICDRGFAVVAFCYKDVAEDADDGFCGKLEKKLIGSRKQSTAGKIALWSFAASCIMDYVVKIDNIDTENIAVIGHSRLGKTALLTGAVDSRFKYVISSQSGCSGASLSLGKTGETIQKINKTFPYWFAEKYNTYSDKEETAMFDQHFLLSLVAPRYLYVSSAAEDKWSDPDGEYFSCVLADKAYKRLGLSGFVHPERLPENSEDFTSGNIGYHRRTGKHFLSRYDWNKYMDFIKSKM